MTKHLSYANVMATIALFLALGGGAYAAIKLPKNSVGAKQIKAGAVGSSEVANHSLKVGDFKGGLPEGPRGPKGDRGAAAAKHWARIGGGANPAVGANSGGITVSRTDNGATHVSFPADVSKCAANLTLRGGAAGRTIRIIGNSTADTIDVFTSFVDGAGATTTTNDAYDIAVFC